MTISFSQSTMSRCQYYPTGYNRTGTRVGKGSRINVCKNVKMILSHKLRLLPLQLTFKSNSSHKRIRAQATIEMSLYQWFTTNLILFQRTAGTADIWHFFAATTKEWLITIVTHFRHFIYHGRAIVQRCTFCTYRTFGICIIISSLDKRTSLRSRTSGSWVFRLGIATGHHKSFWNEKLKYFT